MVIGIVSMLFIIAITGFLLGWKKNSNGIILPKSYQGTSIDLKDWLPLDTLQTIAFEILKDSIDLKLKSFEDLVLTHSDDIATKEIGGVVGYTERGTLFKEYEIAAYSGEIGEVLGPIKTTAGYHIIKVLDKKGEKIKTQHLLTVVSPTGEDKRKTVLLIQDIYNQTQSDFLFLEDYINTNTNEETTSLTGNYNDYFYNENLPVDLAKKIDGSEDSFLFEPFILNNETIALLYVYEKFKEEISSVENSYSYIESLAKEDKVNKYLDKWLVEAKKEVYINIFVE